MTQAAQSPSTPIEAYVALIRERIDDAQVHARVTLRYSDLTPAPLVDGLYASFDGIIASSHHRTRTYSWSRPSSSFLEEALSNLGYVADPDTYFAHSQRTSPSGSRVQGIGAFQHAFNDLMRGACRITSYTTHHRNGRVLVDGALSDDVRVDELTHRVYVEPRIAQIISELRSLRDEWLNRAWR